MDFNLSLWAKEKPGMDTLALGVVSRMERLTKHLAQEKIRCHKAAGLKPGEFDVLAALRLSGAPYRLTPSALLEALMLTSGAMTNRLDKLETKGLIRREHGKNDRRSIDVCLTPKGVSIVAQVLTSHVSCQQKLLAGLPQAQQQELNQLLSQWLASFEAPSNR